MLWHRMKTKGTKRKEGILGGPADIASNPNFATKVLCDVKKVCSFL
jgi:hypothetical protein